MRYEPVDGIYVIREICTGKLIKFGTKGGWISVRAAKNAFNLHMKWHFDREWSGKKLFDEQDRFVIEVIE